MGWLAAQFANINVITLESYLNIWIIFLEPVSQTTKLKKIDSWQQM